MATRKLGEQNIRKLTKLGGKSIAVTIPVEFVRVLGWKEKQKVVVDLQRKKLIIKDWKQ